MSANIITGASSYGFGHFLEQTDMVGMLVLLLLMLMSVLSWYLILLKTWQQLRLKAASRSFLTLSSALSTYREAEAFIDRKPATESYGRILEKGVAACRLLQRQDEKRGFDMTVPDDFVSATLHTAIAEEERLRESGLSTLASVGSTAPFLGLLGTVWGIYHALLAISHSGQASLDRIAGPVGEALVMTACGLAVAIPAVLAYNAFVRLNRQWNGELESYAHRVFGVLALGRMQLSPAVVDFAAVEVCQGGRV
jgi:biopolymer transport protein ExbB